MNTSANLRAHARRRGSPGRSPAARLTALVFAATLLLLAAAPRARAQDAQPSPQPSPQSSPTRGAQTPDAPNDNTATTITPKSAAGSITGRVLGDGGEPLAGARVTALTASANRSNVQTAAASDEGGNFRVDNLPPGLYRVGAAMRGYVADPEAYPAGRPAPLHRPGDTVTIRLIRGGVITGTVTGGDNEPLVAINVRAVYARDLDGDATRAGITFGEDQTDDRGVYRIYGLPPGVYVVYSAGTDPTRGNWPGAVSAYRGEAPTYYPSGTRDTAAEVTVRGGQEAAGIDIRHRGERGRRVTGIVIAPPGGTNAGSFVTLTHAASGTQVGSAPAQQQPGASEHSFSFEAIPDGEYEAQARNAEGGFFLNTSAPVRVVVSGGDVTGLRLTLARLGSVSGSLVVEPAGEAERAKGECKERRTTLLPQESVVTVQQEEASKIKAAALRGLWRRETAPDSSGAFTLRGLEAGRYRFDVRLADDNWYVRDVQLPAPASTTAPTAAPARPGAARRPAAASATTTTAASAAAPRDSLELKPGQQLAGVTVRVAEGAATLSGRLAPARNDDATAATVAAPLPPSSRLRVHLVPAARELAENALRYAETTPAQDGSFAFTNLAPGRYFLLAREAEAEAPARPAAWDAAGRARLRREAEAANVAAELQPCQRQTDFALRFQQPPVK